MCVSLLLVGCGKKDGPTPKDDASTAVAEHKAAPEQADAAQETKRKPPKRQVKPAPPLQPVPSDVAEIGREVVEGIRANEEDALNEPHIKYDTYAKREVMLGLGVEDRLIEKLGPKFFWADTSSDSAEALRTLLQVYGGKDIEFVKLEFGEYETNDHLELWKDLVLTVRIDGGEAQPIAALGEIIKEKATGDYWVLRYRLRKLPPREGDPSVTEAPKTPGEAATTKAG